MCLSSRGKIQTAILLLAFSGCQNKTLDCEKRALIATSEARISLSKQHATLNDVAKAIPAPNGYHLEIVDAKGYLKSPPSTMRGTLDFQSMPFWSCIADVAKTFNVGVAGNYRSVSFVLGKANANRLLMACGPALFVLDVDEIANDRRNALRVRAFFDPSEIVEIAIRDLEFQIGERTERRPLKATTSGIGEMEWRGEGASLLEQAKRIEMKITFTQRYNFQEVSFPLGSAGECSVGDVRLVVENPKPSKENVPRLETMISIAISWPAQVTAKEHKFLIEHRDHRSELSDQQRKRFDAILSKYRAINVVDVLVFAADGGELPRTFRVGAPTRGIGIDLSVWLSNVAAKGGQAKLVFADVGERKLNCVFRREPD